MEMTIGAGAVLDIASGKELSDARDSILKGNKRPKFQIVRGSGSVIGTGVVAQFPIICNGSPSGPGAGYIWTLDSICTFSQDDHTLYNPTPGTSFVGAIYVGASAQNLSLSQLAFPGFTFPGVFDFSDGQYAQHGESIVCSTSAALAAGQQIGVNLWARQYRVTDLVELSGR
jgi:hypothetical protein